MEKLFPDPYQKMKIEPISESIHTVCVYCILSGGLLKYIETKLETTCFFVIFNFLKQQKVSRTNPPVSFSAWFLKKNICLIVFLLTGQISLSDCFYFGRYWTTCVS